MVKGAVYLPLIMLSFDRKALRSVRKRYDLHGLVDIHHVIPRSCARHPSLRSVDFSVEDPGNLALMPTKKGGAMLRLRPGRLLHTSGHLKYNTYVFSSLDNVQNRDDLNDLLANLHREIRSSTPRVPWN